MTEQKTICPLKYLAEVFGGKWKMPIICVLSGDKPQRYSVIKRRIGDITNMMLAHSLKELEHDGMINRTQYNEVPPRVEYSLTDKGRSAIPMLTSAVQWALQDMHSRDIHAYCEECQSRK